MIKHDNDNISGTFLEARWNLYISLTNLKAEMFKFSKPLYKKYSEEHESAVIGLRDWRKEMGFIK